MTEETKRELLRDYENKNITVSEIAEKYGINRPKVAQIAVEMGAQPRREKVFGKKRGHKGKTCPKCKKLIEVQGARFCYYCGADIRSNRDMLIEKNEELLQVVPQLPQNIRDIFRDVLLANIKELKETETTK
jgi:hypothetical protein